MMRIIVHGAAGHMGAELMNLIEAGTENACLAAAVDKAPVGAMLASLDGFKGEADAVIDFSHHSAVCGLLDWAVRTNTPAVVATTGFDEAEKEAIRAAAEKIPVFWAANMSLGIALMAEMAAKLAAAFPNADVEIVEKHHTRKIDAPSGTALALFDAVREGRPEAVAVLGRSGMKKHEKNEVGIHALRMGNLPGEHEVIFTTDTQSISLKHEVYDRAMLAEGALTAAKFLIGKPAGIYGMKELISK